MFSDNCILVVEDDSDHFSLIEDGLRRGRVANEVRRVSTASDAVAYLNGEGAFADREIYPLPCLVLLDLKLPDATGLKVLQSIRESALLKKLPVVVLTVSDRDEDLDRAYALGVNSYLRKPFKIEDFRALAKSLNAYWVLLAQKPHL